MKTLVTGATGFIGSTLTRQLLDRGAEVRILRRTTSKLDLLGEAAQHVKHVLGDVTDPESLRAAMDGVQHVYHTAASVVLGGRRDRALLHRVNVYGTACVVDAALDAGVTRLVHTSSIAALGRPEGRDAPIDENTAWQASRFNTPYAVSKHEAELEIHRGIAEGLDAVMVNPSLVFGVGRPGENTRQVAERIRDGRFRAVPTGGTNVVDVEDVAAGHVRAMDYGQTGARYLLGGENLMWQAIVETLAEALGVAPPRRSFTPGLAMALASVLEAVAFVTRTRPLLTRTIARNVSQVYTFSNRKAIDDLGCTFRPFAATAKRIAEAIG